MLYDLNLPWSPTIDQAQLERTISFLSSLGYTSLALSYTVSSPIPPQITNPIPITLPFTLPAKVALLRRCTLTISDPSHNHRLSALAAAYDILALRPTNEKSYLAACLSLTEHSLISLDLTQRYPFHWKPKPLMTAINRGIRIEICYAQATEGDSGARRNFISNCLGIIRATRGRGLVISSEARNVLGARAPADVLNLLGVWGLSRERGTESMGVNPRAVVVNEGLKRSAFRGVVDVVYGGESDVVPEKEKAKEKGKEKEISKGVGNKGGKRKQLEEPNADGIPQVSKRAAKRAKMQAQQAEKEASSGGGTPASSGAPKSAVPQGSMAGKVVAGAEILSKAKIKANS